MHQDVVLRFEQGEDFKGTLRTYLIPMDQVGFEHKFGESFTDASGRAEWMLWFIWRALKREHPERPEFEEFIEDLREYKIPKDEAEGPDPTPTPPSE